jgi:hypothetical protein
MVDPPKMRGVKKPRFQSMQGMQESQRPEPQGRHIKWEEDGTVVDVSAGSSRLLDQRSEHAKRKREGNGESSGHEHPDKKQKNANRCVLVMKPRELD